MNAYEVNFDGLVGPTHNYAGLSYGNIASASHALGVSNPKAAALQGLEKMKRLADMGLKQAILPPQERPDLYALRDLGFSGSDADILAKASHEAPQIFHACCSASSMWTANAATVSPSADSADGRVHFTPANLSNKFHRSIEHPTTGRILKAIFSDEECFVHHPALPPGEHFSDEGAANHTRLCVAYGEPGLQLFVYGRHAFQEGAKPQKFPARQTYEASAAIARRHQLDSNRVVYAQQNPAVIDAGVFHNDVIAVGNGNVLFYHAQAFHDSEQVLAEIRAKFPGEELYFIRVDDQQVSVEDAVKTYLFNTQLLSLSDGSMVIIAPTECEEHAGVKQCLETVIAGDNPLTQVYFMDLRESMKNGGGPACLRQRVVLTEAELARTNPVVFMNDALYQRLCDWVQRYYRDRLAVTDLADPALLQESRSALDELTQILNLGSVYPFQ